MITQQERELCTEHRYHKCISWSAIFAGAFVASGLTFLLQIFDQALGITIATTNNPLGVETLVWGGFIGSIIGVIASLFFSGWIAGYLGRFYCLNQRHGILYGLLAWCVSVVMAMILFAHANSAISVQGYQKNATSVATMSAKQQPTSVVAQQGAQKSANLSRSADEATTKITLSLFLTFILFFVGAVSSCFGGYCGAKTEENFSQPQKVVIKKKSL